MTPCPHLDFVANAEIGRITATQEQVVNPADADGRSVPHHDDEVIAYRCALTVKCAACGAAFGFRTAGVVGDLPDRPAVSPDALELRVPLISPAELEILGPLAALRASDGLTGFRVRVG
jgi:hypothetical protein